jgi:hypothetical protein
MGSPCCLCVCMRTLPSLLGNGSVNMFPRQRIHTQQNNCWTRCFYAVRVVSEGRLCVCMCTPIVARQRLNKHSRGKECTRISGRIVVRVLYAVRGVSEESLCLCTPSLLGNGSVNTFPQ